MAVLPPDPHSSNPFTVGDWVVEPGLSRLSRGSEEHYLEPKLMAVLMCLAARTDQIVSNDTLIHEVWNNRPMGDNPVYRCIAELRKAFGDDSHRPAYIVTVPKRGYRLIAPVARAEPESLPEVFPGSDSPHSSTRQQRMPVSIVAATLSAIVVSVVLAAFFSGDGTETPFNAAGISLAVMPFSDSTGSNIALTGGGMAQEISRQLAEGPGLRMISYNSTSSLPAATADIKGIADLLGADYLLIGRISHQNENSIEVHPRLMDARGEEVWSQAFSVRPNDILGLIGDIARGVADSLNVPFDPEWVTACGGTRNIAACQKYKLASEHLRTRGDGFKPRSLQLFEAAITQDPGFAAAYAGMVFTYLVPGTEFPWPEAVRRAGTATQRALELDDTLPEAHVAQAFVAMTDDRGPCPPICRDLRGFEEAEQAAHRALSLSPRAPAAHNALAIALAGQGKLRDGFSHLNTALLHDPLSPALNYNIAVHKAYQGDYAAAIEHVRGYIEAHPNAPALMYEAWALIEHYYGNFDASLGMLEKIADSHSSSTSAWLLTENYHNLGLFDRVQDVLEQRKNTPYYDTLLALTSQRLLVTTGRLEELDDVSRRLAEYAAETYGADDRWPRQIHQRLGLNMFLAGRFDQAVAWLTRVHGEEGALVAGPYPTIELDSLHALGHSLRMIGRPESGDAIVEWSLTLIADRESQGYGGLPDLIAAKARTFAMQGKRALAVATMRMAVAEGWRGYRSTNFADDPRWDLVSGEPDFEALLARVREDVDEMRERMEFRIAGVGREN